jgi:ABC-2 type transport system ATP-binding protein
MIQVEGLVKRFDGITAVDGLDFAIPSGSVLCLLGPNGAGKSTTLKMILGLVKPSAGKVIVDGIDVAAHPDEARKRLAYIPEMVSLHEAFTGYENLEYFAALTHAPDLSRATLEGCLQSAGLQGDAWRRPLKGYSKGMRQKVGVAIALAKCAKALVLDEPTSGLDPSAAFEFTEIVRQTAARGAAVIVATHDLFRARDMGSDIIILKGGRIARRLDPAQISYEEIEAAYLDIFRRVA